MPFSNIPMPFVLGELTQTRQLMAAWLLLQLGKPYNLGATGPDTWDCSQLVIDCMKHVGRWPGGDDTAQGLFNRWHKFQTFKPLVCDLVFYGGSKETQAPDTKRVVHVAFFWGQEIGKQPLIYGANGMSWTDEETGKRRNRGEVGVKQLGYHPRPVIGYVNIEQIPRIERKVVV